MEGWAERLAAALASAGTPPTPPGREVRIVLEIEGASPPALTLVLGPDGARVEGRVEHPDATVRLDEQGRLALARGASALGVLRDGRVRVSGDVALVVGLVDWLAASTSRDD